MTTKRKVLFAVLFGLAFIGAWRAGDIGVLVGTNSYSMYRCIYWTPFQEVAVAWQYGVCPALRNLAGR